MASFFLSLRRRQLGNFFHGDGVKSLFFIRDDFLSFDRKSGSL